MAETIATVEAKQIIMTLEGAERFVPAWIASGSRKGISGFKDTYQSIAKKFIRYLEDNFGKDELDKETFSGLLIKFLIPFCSPGFLKAYEKKPFEAWKAIEMMLHGFTHSMDLNYVMGNGKFELVQGEDIHGQIR
jgi:hypothetical protein